MATINCPHGSRWISRRHNLIFEFRDVQIFNDLCDHSDSCGIEQCEYYDNSPQANKRYLQGLYRSYSMEGMIEDKAYKKHLLEKHAPPNPENSEKDRG